MEHHHVFDADGRQLCCTLEEKIYNNADAKQLISNSRKDAHDHDHGVEEQLEKGWLHLFLPSIISLVLLMTAIAMDQWGRTGWFEGWIRTLWYVAAYLPVGWPVVREALESVAKGEIFSEFMLMVIATVGAFAIGEYPEAVAVMLFYAVGEIFQTLAVRRAKTNINSLLDQRPDKVTIMDGEEVLTVHAEDVEVKSVIRLKPGEKLALDGVLLTDNAAFNTAALTGESQPVTKSRGDVVLAGMINLNSVALVQVTTAYEDSKLSKILEMVQHAASRKAPTELFIRKFARYYTPAVVVLAVAICLLPYFFVSDYVFNDWLYRALIFLVISCPCALVISIPLGYFGGIGAASRNGILIKGSNFLDALASIQNVVMDKTGTLTEGVFKVHDIVLEPGFVDSDILDKVNALEHISTHPVATAIHEYVGPIDTSIKFNTTEEIPGQGLRAMIDGKEILVGNFRLMDNYGINYVHKLDDAVFTVICIAFDGVFAGYITIADSIKKEAMEAVRQLHNANIKTIMLSGDKASVVNYVAEKLHIDQAHGELLPEDKVNKVKSILDKGESVAFVGDGLNDAPVIAICDVGIAMGGLGSDATIETADVVIQDDLATKIPMAIRIGKETKKIVWQNVFLAFAIKVIVLMMGAGGIATMWEAVFADVGVALLAILNAVRIQRMKF